MVGIVVEIKEMPYDEKYKGVLDGVKVLEAIALQIVKEDLGDEKVAELKSTWQKQSENIPEGVSYEEKYEVAFRNWLRNWQSAYNLINNQLGKRGTEKFISATVKENERRSAGPSLYLLKFIRAISPQTAFRTFGKQMAYKLQEVLTPLSISELTGHRMVLNVPHCKFLDVEGCTDPCKVACQKISPLWMEEQFNIKMFFELKEGKSCTVTLAPL